MVSSRCALVLALFVSTLLCATSGVTADTYSVCGSIATVLQSEGDLVSHEGYGSSNYENNQDCTLVLESTLDRQIIVTFNEFDLEEDYDYLFVSSGGIEQSLTGNLGSFGIVSSPGEDLILQFKSDGTTTNAGFSATFTSQTSQLFSLCNDTTISAKSGSISDLNLDNGITCSGTITVGDGEIAIIHILSLDLEAGLDTIHMSSGEASVNLLTSGHKVYGEVGSDVVLNLATDNNRRSNGYIFLFNVVPAENITHYFCEEKHILSSEGRILSHRGFGTVPYPTNVACTITIRVPIGYKAVVNVESLELENGFDFLRASSGSLSTVLKESGNFTSDLAYDLVLTFQSGSSITYEGFELTYFVERANISTITFCDADLVFDDAGIIVSHEEFGSLNHDHNISCTLRIPKQPGKFIFVKIVNFDLEDGYDFLQLSSGSITTSDFSSGSTFFSPENEDLVMTFTSDATESRSGFVLIYEFSGFNQTVWSVCDDDVVFTREGKIVSHATFGQEDYSSDMDCKLSIKTNPLDIVIISFESFEVEAQYDVVTLTSGTMSLEITNGNMNGTFVGEIGQGASISFVTDSSTNMAGFELSFSVSESNLIAYTLCKDNTTQGNEGVILSHEEYSSANYNNKLNCGIVIPGVTGYVTIVTIVDIELEDGFDVMTINDGVTSSSSFLSGDIYVGEISASVNVSFTSDFSSSYGGFLLSYIRIEESSFEYSICEVDTLVTSTGKIVSHAGVGTEQYASGQNCELSISVRVLQQLKITVEFFDLQDTDELLIQSGLNTLAVQGTSTEFVGDIGQNVLISFTSSQSSAGANGFRLSYSLETANVSFTNVCSDAGEISASSGYIASHDVNVDDTHSNNLNCSLVLKGIDGLVTVFYFNVYDLEDGFDVLTVTSSGISSTSFSINNFYYAQPGQDITFHFTSDGSVGKSGFLIAFERETPSSVRHSICDSFTSDLRELSGEIVSHDGYGSVPYNGSLDCSVTITPPVNGIISITIVNFDLYVSDSLEITSASHSRFISSSDSMFTASPGEAVELDFKSSFFGGLANATGFLLQWSVEVKDYNENDMCKVDTFSDSYGYITSHSLLHVSYGNNLDCMANITVGEGFIAFIRVLRFELEFADDFIVNTGTQSISEFKAGDVVFGEEGQPISLSFMSDSSVGKSGFLLEYEIVSTEDATHYLCAESSRLSDPFIHAFEGTIYSHKGYGATSYSPQSDCNVFLHVPDGYTATIVVANISVEAGFDFLTLSSGPNVDSHMYKGKMFRSSVGQDIRVSFTSDDTKELEGFELYFYLEKVDIFSLCNAGVISSTSGQIRSHDSFGTSTYENNLNCTLTLSVPEGSIASLVVASIDVEVTDSVTIQSGLIVVTHQSLKSGFIFYSNPGDDVVITFTTDSSIRQQGFAIDFVVEEATTIRQSVCSVNETFATVSEIVSHEAFGSANYPPQTRCSLIIRVPPGSVAKLVIAELDIEDGFDFLTITSGSQSVNKFHANSTFTGDPETDVVVSFTSDASLQGKGFLIQYEVVESNLPRFSLCDSATIPTSAEVGLIVSHEGAGSTSHSSNLDCTTVLSSRDGYVPLIRISKLDLEEGYDTLDISVGSTSIANVVEGQSFFGKEGVDTTFHFVSDHNTAYTGFVVSYEFVEAADVQYPLCTFTHIVTSSGFIVSHDSFGAEGYSNNVDCTLTIKVPSKKVARVSVLSIELEEGSDILTMSSGSLSRNSFAQDDVFEGGVGVDVTITFISDFALTYDGFKLEFEITDPDLSFFHMCNNVTESSEPHGLIYSHSDFGNDVHDANLDCIFTIQVAEGYIAELHFLSFDLEEGFDVLTITSGNVSSSDWSSGQLHFGEVGENVVLSFSSDTNLNKDGFAIEFFIRSTSDVRHVLCGQSSALYATSGEIVSHDGYPTVFYSSNAECSVTLHVADGFVGVVRVIDLELEEGYDLLKISSGVLSSLITNSGAVFIGENSEDLVFEFTSDTGINDQGFLLQFEVVRNSLESYNICERNAATTPKGIVNSHTKFGKDSHPSGVTCAFHIFVAADELVTFHVRVLDLGMDMLMVTQSDNTTLASSSSLSVGQRLFSAVGENVTLLFTTAGGSDAIAIGTGFSLYYEVEKRDSVRFSMCVVEEVLAVSGEIVSHAGYGSSKYDNNVDCSLTIYVPDDSIAVVSVLDISIELGFDILRIASGPKSSTFTSLGAIFTSGIGEDVIIDFISDESKQEDGFLLSFEVKSANITNFLICRDSTTFGTSGRILGHEGAGDVAHGNGIDCNITIPVPVGEVAILRIAHLDLEERFDFLTITYGSTSVSSVVLNQGDEVVSEPGVDVFLRFTADETVAKTGFIIWFDTVSATNGFHSLCSDANVYSVEGSIVSHPSFGVNEYPSAIDCALTLHVPFGFVASLRVVSLDIEVGIDILRLSSGGASTSITNNNVDFVGGVGEDVIVSFVTDSSLEGDGFEIVYEVTKANVTEYVFCRDVVATASQASIVSHEGYGSTLHDGEVNCTLTVTVPENFIAVLFVEAMDLEEGYDFLKFTSGDLSTGSLNAGDRFFGRKGKDVVLDFKTDRTINHAGFHLSYELVSAAHAQHEICKAGNIYSLSGEVVSHAGINGYGHNVECSVTIHVPTGYFATINVELIDIEVGFDILTISSGSTSTTSFENGTEVVGGVGENVEISFSSDFSVSGDGFVLAFSVVDANITTYSICSSNTIEDSRGEILSHVSFGYGKHENDLNCNTTLRVPAGSIAVVTVEEIDLETGYDVIHMASGDVSSYEFEKGTTFIGLKSTDVQIFFETDSSVANGGFRLSFEIVDAARASHELCSVTDVYTSQGEISGGNFSSEVDCTLTLHVPHDSIATITFVEYDLNEDTSSLNVSTATKSAVSFQRGSTFFADVGETIQFHLATSGLNGGSFLIQYVVERTNDTRTSICDTEDTISGRGFLVSHTKYGATKYPVNVECTVTLNVPLTAIGRVRIIAIDVEPTFDYLSLSSGSVADVSFADGDVFTGELGTDVVITFHSDLSISSNGFLIEYEVVSENIEFFNICDGGVITSTFGGISSHESFGTTNHDNNLNCNITLQVPDGLVAVITVNAIELEEGYDFLTISSGDFVDRSFENGDEFFGREGKDVLFNFVADFSTSSPGFFLTYKLLNVTFERHSVCSDPVIYARSGELISHVGFGSTSYPPRLDCTTTVRVPPGYVARVFVEEFDVEEGFDSLTLASGLESLKPTVNGTWFEGEVGEDLTVTFETDSSINKDGFLLSFQVTELNINKTLICDGPADIYGAFGEVLSHGNFGGSDHDNNISCSVTIHAPANGIVVITAEEFDLELGYDFLVLSSPSTFFNVLQSGDEFFGRPGESVVVRFTADESITSNGFRLSYEVVDASLLRHGICEERVLYTPQGEIVSHSEFDTINSTHGSGIDCQLTIKVPSGFVALVTVVSIDLEEGYDVLRMSSGLQSTINFEANDVFTSGIGENVYLDFSTDATVNKGGFLLQYVVVSANVNRTDICSADTVSDSIGEIVSHENYGMGSHGENISCTVVISVPADLIAVLTVVDLELENGYDFLLVGNGNTMESLLYQGQKYFSEVGEDVTLTFTADGSISGAGFLINYEILAPEVVRHDICSSFNIYAPEGEIVSHADAGGNTSHPHGVDCSVVLHVPSGSVAMLVFNLFDLEDGFDVLTVTSGVKSRDSFSTNSTFHGLVGSDVVLRFTADRSVANAGFIITFKVVDASAEETDICSVDTINDSQYGEIVSHPDAGSSTHMSNLDCSLTLIAPPGFSIYIYVNFIDLELGFDSLTVASTSFNTSSDTSLANGFYYSFPEGEDVTFHFFADGTVSGVGFSILYDISGESLRPSTTPTISSTSVSTRSSSSTFTTTTILTNDICTLDTVDSSNGPFISGSTKGVSQSCSITIPSMAENRIVIRVNSNNLEVGEMITFSSDKSSSSDTTTIGSVFYGDAGASVDVSFTASAQAGVRDFNVEFVYLDAAVLSSDLCALDTLDGSGSVIVSNPFQDTAVDCSSIVTVGTGSFAVISISDLPVAGTVEVTSDGSTRQLSSGEQYIGPVGQDVTVRFTSSGIITQSIAFAGTFVVNAGLDVPPTVTVNAKSKSASPQTDAGTTIFSLDITTHQNMDYTVSMDGSTTAKSLFELVDDAITVKSSPLTVGSFVLNVQVSDSRTECKVSGADGSIATIPGPCTAEVALTVIVPELVGCGVDEQHSLGVDQAYNLQFDLPTLSPSASDATIAPTLAVGSMLTPGTYTLAFHADLRIGPRISCEREVAVSRGFSSEIGTISTLSTNSQVTSRFIDNAGGTNTVLKTFSLTDTDDAMTFIFSSPEATPFSASSYQPDGNVQSRFSFDLRFCSGGLAFPDVTADAYVTVEDLVGGDVMLVDASSASPAFSFTTAKFIHSTNTNAPMSSRCLWLVVDSDPFTNTFGFSAIQVSVMITSGSRRRDVVLHAFEPQSPSTAGVTMAQADGQPFASQDAKSVSPLSLQNAVAPVISNCPSSSITVAVESDATTFQATLPTLDISDATGTPTVTGPADGGIQTFNVVDSPITITVTAANTLLSTVCSYMVIAVAPIAPVEVSGTMALTETSVQDTELNTKTKRFNILPSTSTPLEFSNAKLNELNEIDITLHSPPNTPIYARDTSLALSSILFVSVAFTSDTAFSSATTLDSSVIRASLEFYSDNTVVYTAPMSEAVTQIALKADGSQSTISIASSVSFAETIKFSSVKLKLIYINDGSLPSDESTWHLSASSFLGFYYTFSSSDTTVPQRRSPVAFFDNTPPVFESCPDDITVYLTGNRLTASVTWASPTVEDSSVVVIAPDRYSSGSGTFDLTAPDGTGVEVVYEAIDKFGNTAECSFVVKVLDNTKPTVSCGSTVRLELSSDAAAIALQESDWGTSVSDNTDSLYPVTLVSPLPSVMYAPGRHMVPLVYEDGYGNAQSCTATLVVVDVTPPSVTCPTSFSVEYVANAVLTGSSATPTLHIAAVAASNQYMRYVIGVDSSDNVAVDFVEISSMATNITQSPEMNDAFLFPVGETTLVSAFAVDTSGNENSCSFAVTVGADPNPQSSSSKSLGTGAVAAIVLVVVVVLIVLIVITRRRPKSHGFENSGGNSFDNPLYEANLMEDATEFDEDNESVELEFRTLDNPLYDTAENDEDGDGYMQIGVDSLA
eukprot:m.233632 g.233632  ORF g.233632 m.233632 type:complete len:5157 (+) comp13909_c2_seq1:156-15626(+)